MAFGVAALDGVPDQRLDARLVEAVDFQHPGGQGGVDLGGRDLLDGPVPSQRFQRYLGLKSAVNRRCVVIVVSLR